MHQLFRSRSAVTPNVRTIQLLLAILVLPTLCRGQLVDLKSSAGQARVSVVSPRIFRISASLNGPADPIKSLFVTAPPPAANIGRREDVGAVATLRTNAGAIVIDTMAGTWQSLGVRRKTIGPAVPLVTKISTQSGEEIAMPVPWPAGQPFKVWGGGNDEPQLQHGKIKSRVGNGVAVVPFWYAPELGLATFAISEDDDHPMSCDADGAEVRWHARGTHADLYVIVARSLDEAVSSYNTLTGTPPVPPRWAFGYLQSRWGWESRAYIDHVLDEFVTRKLPVDAFIFDFEWYTAQPDYEVKPQGVDGFPDFGWNSKVFPEPAVQIAKLHEAGVHVVGIRKPRLGDSQTLEMARRSGWIVQPARKREGFESRNLNFALPDVRAWYAKQTQPLLSAGIDGWWDDEGELTYTTYRRWNEAQIESLKAVRPGGRHWSLNRAFSPGMQRLGAAAWTGDVGAKWEVLQRTPASLLNWSIAGMTYGACDIGGFFDEPTPELLVRWMQAGVFFPVMRTHSVNSVKPHFPWLYGADAEAAMKKALELRYQLVPMLYSLAHAAHETGLPIMRPLAAEFPDDPVCAEITDQWMIGRLMPAPVLTPGGKRSVYLPAGEWFDFSTGEKLTGGRTLDVTVSNDAVPVYVRSGTILALGPVVQRTRDLATGPLEMRIYPGQDATFTLVEDDGETNAYLNGQVRRTTFSWDDAKRTLTWKQSGEYDGTGVFKSMRVAIAGAGSTQFKEVPLKRDGSVTP